MWGMGNKPLISMYSAWYLRFQITHSYVIYVYQKYEKCIFIVGYIIAILIWFECSDTGFLIWGYWVSDLQPFEWNFVLLI